jgi:hypothetical protein
VTRFAAALAALALGCAPSPHLGPLPAGWRIEADGDLVTSHAFRFPVVVAGAVRRDPGWDPKSGVAFVPYARLRDSLSAALVFFGRGTFPDPPSFALDALVQWETGARLEKSVELPLPLGDRRARGCHAVLRRDEDVVWLFAVADWSGPIGVRVGFRERPDEDVAEDAWRLGMALLRLIEPPAAERAAMPAERYAPPAFAAPCPDAARAAR